MKEYNEIKRMYRLKNGGSLIAMTEKEYDEYMSKSKDKKPKKKKEEDEKSND